MSGINPNYFATQQGSRQDPTTDEALLWPQASGELLSYANHLEQTGAIITAQQIRMAVHRANRLTPDGRAMDVGVK